MPALATITSKRPKRRSAASIIPGQLSSSVTVLAHLTPAQRRAYVLADNKLALNAGWDLDFTDSGAGPHSTWDERDLCVQPSIPKD